MNTNPASKQTHNKALHISLWTAQIILAILLIMGAVMKFMPIQQIATMMPWTGQIPSFAVRLLGITDLLGALGLILPAWLRIKPQLTSLAAAGVIVLMSCAIAFHVSRGEASVIGINIFTIIAAAFVAWGRWKKVPILCK
jgi:hypothetical protein